MPARAHIAAAFLVSALWGGPASVANTDWPELTLLTSENPPFTYGALQDGVPAGASVDLMRKMMQDGKVPYSLTLMPWNRAYQHALEDANTCLFVTNRLPDREDKFRWVGPLYEGGWGIYKRPGSDMKIQGIDDLAGKAIAGTFNADQAQFVEHAYHATPLRVEDDIAAAKLLYMGRADLWLSGLLRNRAVTRVIGEPPAELALLLTRADLYLACSLDTSAALTAHLNAVNTELDEERNASLDRHSQPPEGAGDRKPSHP
ncbi:MAG: transporter substrate-binding domain-containing protein [Alphaproteobacteria bacterium]|nr:MAG: transporter substrate-binding domain-containing protein [Alphaproteobacteria bacterium]